MSLSSSGVMYFVNPPTSNCVRTVEENSSAGVICAQGVVPLRGFQYRAAMRTDAKGRIEVQAGGWVAWTDDDFPGFVSVRFVDDQAGRLVPVDVVVVGDGAVTANHLRQAPLGNVEALANRLETARQVRARMATPGPDVRAGLRKPRKPREAKKLLQADIRVLLEPPAGEPERGDWFYKRVAHVYQELHRTTSAPTSAIAEALEVPVSTAKAWVRKAREKEYLPPARQGKAG